jgi:hypothetical protein
MAGWKRFALMFLMVAVPVPVFAASGLAVPLPAVVYRAAVGLAEQTQAVAVRVPGIGAVVAETTRVTRRGTIRFSAEELASGGGEQLLQSEPRPEARAPAAQAARRRRHVREPKSPVTNAAPLARARRANPRHETEKALAVPGEESSRAAAKQEKPHPAEAPSGRSETAGEQKHDAPSREEGKGGSAPAPAHPAETKNAPAPKEDSNASAPSPPTAPPPAPPPPPPSSPLPVTPPVNQPSDPLPLTPEAQLDAIADDLRELIEAKPGTRRADRLQQVLDKVESASARLAKRPPDNDGAIGDIRNAVQKLDAALLEGVISPLERTEFVTRLEAVSTLLKARL